jgi:hypothetical protein
MDDDKIKLGRLWKGVSAGGTKYLNGQVERGEQLERALALLRRGGRLLVLPNNRKREGKKDPDCELFVTPERERR